MNLIVLSGRMYNGTVYPYEDGDKNDRTVFRGRLNFRTENGEYEWIDCVCWRDNINSDSNGTVGWLEKYFEDEGGKGEGHGKAIELVGKLSPVTKKHTVKLKGGKEIPNVKYPSFELVIDSANFPPISQGEREDELPDGEDFEDDDLEVDEIEDDDAEDERPARRSSSNSRGSRPSSKNPSSAGKAKDKAKADDDSDFFEPDGKKDKPRSSSSGNRSSSGNSRSNGNRSGSQSGNRSGGTGTSGGTKRPTGTGNNRRR